MNALFDLPEGESGRTPPRQGSVAGLNAVIKRARDIMRKDAGLNGDLDRIPQFSWLLFLKALDAQEEDREDFAPDGFTPLIEAPYRWRDWASCRESERLTGPQLLQFINGFSEDGVVKGLLPHLRRLSGPPQQRIISTIFNDVQNRMLSGYLLRSLVDTINEIDFHAQDSVYTMAHTYESMLQEMRDAAGDSGEFYTPRTLVRFMVRMTAPQPDDTVLDPACGTGGFLVETYEYLRKQHSGQLSTQQIDSLESQLRGIEKKPLPYLLGTMNLLLHGISRPHLTRDNTLNHPIASHRQERVDVILTNPPFGGEEENTVPQNFPTGLRTTETAWLFMQVVMERLREGGRCAIVVPNNILFDGGVGTQIRKKLLSGYNLHTVVRLPNGVFAPYTLIPANVLFFDRTGPTKSTWFYELPLPEGSRNFTKTKPMGDGHLADLETWWGGTGREGRTVSEHAWRVPLKDLDENYNLDLHNPHQAEKLAHRDPVEIIGGLIDTEREILTLLEEVKAELEKVDDEG
ncbi:type I restriction enzyme M protein [Streptomyces sp. 2231.1]|uniref:type I restriction-modification system subunit M n=1 Tax=Streptomyces sp. 2231.1 TaxID=1855347 RepID=UPI0008978ABB|nr:class I SAM-dependent DNA methyltransferase [Streptomyces sp. 2231.1]SED75799.1 type I restriction enzyme M protein [Streptomyces sp. 2231.1]